MKVSWKHRPYYGKENKQKASIGNYQRVREMRKKSDSKLFVCWVKSWESQGEFRCENHINLGDLDIRNLLEIVIGKAKYCGDQKNCIEINFLHG